MFWQVETPQEKIARLRADLEKLQKDLVIAEIELAEMEASMREFETEFNVRVGYLVEELSLIEAELEAYKMRIRQSRMDSTIGDGYQSVEDQYDEKWNAPRRRGDKPKVTPLAASAPVTQARLKKLYRRLAREFHPDLAKDEQERALRTEKMAAINEAYNAGSLVELKALANQMQPEIRIETPAAKVQPSVRDGQTEAEMVTALRKEIDTTHRNLYRTQSAIRNFHHRPLVEFALEAKFAERNGRDFLGEMEGELKKKIARRQVERDMIRSQFDGMSH